MAFSNQASAGLADLPVVNVSEHDEWPAYFDDATRAIAEAAYADDLALWESCPGHSHPAAR